ncbi:condensin subunit ScpB [Clostridium sp. USBA 49]|jgi:segregation and condensation protein B|uniref:SMC-Scp complex subunit ScpB n=2 Tax=Clostridium TaxID=1485 RepID=UPI0009D2F435|nr:MULTISPECIES: SMC-Scp complex subunit ScpB [Clostridium]SKA76715.1 condensin subunit ScpB [Clostridium sp. USBA 49]
MNSKTEEKNLSKKQKYFSIIESLIFVSGEPLKLKEIASIIELDIESTKEIMKELIKKYDNLERGIELVNIEDGYQFVTKSENSNYIQKLLKTNTRQSLSQAALETLSIIAYKQPVTRITIDEIRGVKSDKAISTLLEKGLIKESGRLEVAGRPILYSTTDKFLLYFGLENLQQMPSLDEFLKLEDINNIDI